MGKQLWKPGNMLYPVPAVMVSCGREGEKPNIITIAWTGTICSSPAMVSISVRKNRYSYDIIKETGEFVINLVTEDLLKACDYCGVRSGKDVDKFREMGLTASQSFSVDAPGIGECPVNLECKVRQIIELGSHDLFLAEVTGVVIDDQYLDENGKFNLNQADLTVYSHGEYFGLGDKLGTFGYSVVKKKAAKKKLEAELKKGKKPEKKESEKKDLEKKKVEKKSPIKQKAEKKGLVKQKADKNIFTKKKTAKKQN